MWYENCLSLFDGVSDFQKIPDSCRNSAMQSESGLGRLDCCLFVTLYHVLCSEFDHNVFWRNKLDLKTKEAQVFPEFF